VPSLALPSFSGEAVESSPPLDEDELPLPAKPDPELEPDDDFAGEPVFVPVSVEAVLLPQPPKIPTTARATTAWTPTLTSDCRLNRAMAVSGA
jgi:hypothetical protein